MLYMMSRTQIEDLLTNVLHISYKETARENLTFCCPIHGEKHASSGISVPKNKFNCFACGEKGGIAWFLYKAMPSRFKSVDAAESFLIDRYNLEYQQLENTVNDLDNREVAKQNVLPLSMLKLYGCGEKTHQAFYNMGFTIRDMQYFSVGYDCIEHRIIIPIFNLKGELLGFNGRAIDGNKLRYKIYNFPKSEVIFPLDKVKPINQTIIVVESMLDTMMMHKWGITNTIALNGCSVSDVQAKQISELCDSCVCLLDNDAAGYNGRELLKNKLGKKIFLQFPYYSDITGKDTREWGEEITKKLISNSTIIKRNILRDL